MDVNGSRFHLLLGRGDWARCTDEHGVPLDLASDCQSPPGTSAVAWDPGRHELTLRPITFRFAAGPGDRPPRPTDRRGAGRDSAGNWYWIDDARRGLLVQSSGTGRTSSFWPAQTAAAPARPGAFAAVAAVPASADLTLAGATVTEDDFLVSGVLDPAGLLIFDLLGGGPPVRLPCPPELGFAPADMAARTGGGVFVLDGSRVWELDRHFRVVSSALPDPPAPGAGGFAPQPGTTGLGPAGPPAALRAADATPVPADAVAIEADADCGFLALQRGDAYGSLISRWRDGAQVGAPVRTAGVIGYDLALAGEKLLVADAGGNQAFAFGLTHGADGAPHLDPLETFLPMRRFGGKGLVAAGGGAYYDFEDRWLPLVAQARPRHVEAATVLTPVLDGAVPGCVWHRLMLDARLPHGTRVTVSSRAHDDDRALDTLEWLPEPDPRPRRSGCELPFVDQGPYDTHELLFQRARGRHMQIRLELVGDGRATPRVRALRAWYPRFSYLARYLPRVYRQDPESASFLERYLANVEGFYTAIEDRIAAAQVLLKADTAPADALDWLAGWFDLTLDPLCDAHRRRLLLRNADRVFRARGTIRGVALALRFALEPCLDDRVFDEVAPPVASAVRIVEAYRTRRTPGVVFGDPTQQDTPRAVIPARRWRPDQGRDVLNEGWRAFLAGQNLNGPAEFPLTPPGGDLAVPWRAFATAALAVVPAPPDRPAWSAFLSRRYGSPAALAAAYHLAAAPAGFDDVAPPAALPADGPPLVDWFQFASVVVPTASRAHRFTVLLPWPLRVHDSAGDLLDSGQLRDLATRVVELQKPAHTTFSVRFFWAAFRVGEARIGDDTLLASGSRVPELVSQALLGRNHLGESVLAGPHDVQERP